MFIDSLLRCCVGLSVSEAAKVCNYLHMRKAECVTKKETFQRANYDKSVDFLDSLEEDIPKGMLSAAKPHVCSGAVRKWTTLFPDQRS